MTEETWAELMAAHTALLKKEIIEQLATEHPWIAAIDESPEEKAARLADHALRKERAEAEIAAFIPEFEALMARHPNIYFDDPGYETEGVEICSDTYWGVAVKIDELGEKA